MPKTIFHARDRRTEVWDLAIPFYHRLHNYPYADSVAADTDYVIESEYVSVTLGPGGSYREIEAAKAAVASRILYWRTGVSVVDVTPCKTVIG